MTCRAYFIPVPLLGFALRGFAPCLVPYVLSNAATLLALVKASRNAFPAFRAWPTKQVPPRGSMFSRSPPADTSLGFSLSGVFSSLAAIVLPKENDHPLSCFAGRVACWPFQWHPRVLTATDWVLLSREQPTPMRFFTSAAISNLRTLFGCWVMVSPQKVERCRHRSKAFFFAPAKRPA